jgi:inner membrane protein
MATRRFPLTAKSFALGGVFIALSLALQSVRGIVDEREGRLREAEGSVAASLAAAQSLVGPVLVRDCSESWEASQGEGKDRKIVTERRDFKLSATPATLDVKGDVAIEPRYRGIFKVNGYVLKARLVAAWNDGTALVPEARHADSRLHCAAPVLFVALGDARGVRSAAMQIDGVVVPVLAGTQHAAHPRGFHGELAESSARSATRAFPPAGSSTPWRRPRRRRRSPARRRAASTTTASTACPAPPRAGATAASRPSASPSSTR